MQRIRAQRLGPALFAAGGLALLSGLVWAASLIISWTATCPSSGRARAAIEQGVSYWPPGGECSAQGHTYIYERVPSLKWIVLGFALAAATVLVLGLVTAIRDLRASQPPPAPRIPSAAL